MLKRLADHCGQELAARADTERRLWVLDGDLADSDGAHHFARRHPERFLMAGIAEQNMVSVAAGMAEAGLQPWVFSFAAFLCYRAYDQIRVCLSQARQPVVLLGSHAGGLSARNGKTHSALNDLSLMLSLPGLEVWSPGDFSDVELAVRSLTERPAPAYVRLPRRALAEDRCLPGPAARWRWLRRRQPITLVSSGLASHWALAAAELLEREGLDVGVLHCLTLAPPPPLADLLGDASHVFVVEDHYTFGGLAALVRELGLAARVTAHGWPAGWSGKSGDDEALLELHQLSPAALAQSIWNALDARPGRARVAAGRF